jgi:hypothetical protein
VPAGERQQPAEVGHRARGHGDLDDVGVQGGDPVVDRVEVVGRALEVVPRDDEAPPRLRRNDVGEPGAGLHVHEVEAAGDRLGQQAPASLVVAVREAAALRLRPTGEEDRLRPGREEGGEVEVADEVGAHLEEVGDGGERGHPVDDRGARLLRQADCDGRPVALKHESLSRFP